MAGPTRICVAPGGDLPEAVARHALTHLHRPATGLAQCTLVPAQASLVRPLREALLQAAHRHGVPALLGPRILPYRTWLGLAPEPQPATRELVLFDMLRALPEHFAREGLWQLCDSLLPLFGELGLSRSFRDDPQALRTALRGCAPRPLPGLEREASVVDTLWRAWLSTQGDLGFRDEAGALREAWRERLAEPGRGATLFVAFEQLSPFEGECLARFLHEQPATLAVHGTADHPCPVLRGLLGDCVQVRTPSPAARFIERALRPAPPAMRERASADPATPMHHWAIVSAPHEEAEAQFVAAEIAARLGPRAVPIAVVSENRKLLRRVRALLEMLDIAVDDSAGWTLSTTSAATVVERLLDCVALDFHFRPLLDLLKSPFLRIAGSDPLAVRRSVWRFERDVVRHEQIHSDLDRYQRALARRAHRAGTGQCARWREQQDLLTALGEALGPLRQLHAGGALASSAFLGALRQALTALGCWDMLQADSAGARVTALLRGLEEDAAGLAWRCDWDDLRVWLARALEAQRYVPVASAAPVQLMSLRETAGRSFALVFLIGANEEYLAPAPAAGSAFFNDQVRRDLGLAGRGRAAALTRHRLNWLLGGAGALIATCARERHGEPLQLGRWLEALSSFHAVASGDDLKREPPLASGAVYARVPAAADTARLTGSAVQPCVTMARALLPQTLSAGRHQRLVECPYRFYARDCLRLGARDEMREKLQKPEYGRRVHACLQAYHDDPENAELAARDPQAAAERLTELSRAVFARDLEDDFEHRGWLQRWLRCIPAYLTWEAERAAGFRPLAHEVTRECPLPDGTALGGKIDRVDACAGGGVALVDYKTGRVPGRAAVAAGEDVQLATYALLAEDVRRVEYLQLDARRARSQAVLEDRELEELAAAVRARLLSTLAALRAGASLTAWPGPGCAFCEVQGLCRLPQWG